MATAAITIFLNGKEWPTNGYCKHCLKKISVDLGILENLGTISYTHDDRVDGSTDRPCDGVNCADGANEATLDRAPVPLGRWQDLRKGVYALSHRERATMLSHLMGAYPSDKPFWDEIERILSLPSIRGAGPAERRAPPIRGAVQT